MALSKVPIHSQPDKMSGKVCIADTRMPVEDLFIHLAQGGSIHTFSQEYDWPDLDQLKAVLQFAADDLGNDRGAVERARTATRLVAAERRFAQQMALP